MNNDYNKPGLQQAVWLVGVLFFLIFVVTSCYGCNTMTTRPDPIDKPIRFDN